MGSLLKVGAEYDKTNGLAAEPNPITRFVPMKSVLRLTALLLLPLLVTACSSAPEYPGVKTNVRMGQSRNYSSYAINRNNSQQDHGSLLGAHDAANTDQEICIGAWCSCGTD
jgi:hypothetical protein